MADLYDPLTMPPTLLKVHQKLDATVDGAYALCGGKKTWKSDAECYQRLTSLLPPTRPKASKKRAT